MMVLDRYLFGQFTRNLILVMSSLIIIYILVDLFERLDNFIEAKKSVGLAAQYLLLKIPLMYEQILPVCLLLAGIITLGILHRNHEFQAMKAGGISVFRIVSPLLAGTLFFTLLTLALAQWVLPVTMNASNKIWFEQVKKIVPKGIYRKGRIYHRGAEGIYTFLRPNQRENRFVDLSYIKWDTQHQLNQIITAKSVTSEGNTWTFANGQIKTRRHDGTYNISSFDQKTIIMPESPGDFFLLEYKVDEMSLSHLYEKAQLEDSDDSLAWLDFNRRLSYILLGVPLLLLGIPVLLILHRKSGRDLSLIIPISCGLAFAAWGWWTVAESLAKAAYLHPLLASWNLHVIIGIFGLIMIKRMDR